MNKFYTVESAAKVLDVDRQSVTYWIGIHQLPHDAELVDRGGNIKKVYSLESLRLLYDTHQQDVKRRKVSVGPKPAGFEYTYLGEEPAMNVQPVKVK